MSAGRSAIGAAITFRNALAEDYVNPRLAAERARLDAMYDDFETMGSEAVAKADEALVGIWNAPLGSGSRRTHLRLRLERLQEILNRF